MELYDIIINQEFQSSFLDKIVFKQNLVQILFQYPSVSLTQASLEFAKVLPQFSEANEISIKLNPNCIILSEGYKKIFSGLGQLKNLQKLELIIGNSCLFDQDIFTFFIQNFQELKNLLELQISIFENNILNQNSLKQIDQMLNQVKNLQKLTFVVQNQSYFQNEVLIQFYIGLSYLQNLKILKLNIDFQYLDDLISEQLCNTLQGLQKLETLNILTNDTSKSKNLNNILRCIRYLPNLNCLEISNLILENQDVSDFIEILQQIRCLKKIKLGKTTIENKGAIQQIQNSFQNTNQLEVCDLQFQNIDKLEYRLIQKFGQSIQLLQNLQELSLKMYQNHLSQFNSYVKQINLSQFGISLKYLHNLEKLNLDLKLNQEGYESICEGIDSLQNLKQLIFSITLYEDNTKRKDFRISIGQSLKNKQNLKKLELNFNNEICLNEAKSISEGISFLANLEELSIPLSINMKQELVFVIFQNLNKLSRLKHLQLATNSDIFPQIQYQFDYQIQQVNASFSFSLSNLISLETLDIQINIQNSQAQEFFSLRDSFIQMKNLKYLKLGLYLDFFTIVNVDNLDYLANGLASLINLRNMNLVIDFNYNLNQNDIFFGKVFQNMKHLMKLNLSICKHVTENDLNDITNSFIYLKNLNELHLKLQKWDKKIQILDYFANTLTNLQNLCILELDWVQMAEQSYEKFLQSLRNLKKLNHFIGSTNLINQIQKEVNGNKIAKLSNFFYDSNNIYQHWKREEIYYDQNLDQTEQEENLQLKNIKSDINVVIDEVKNQQQISKEIKDLQKYTFLENLSLQLQSNSISQQDISLLQDGLFSLKFLKSLNISSQSNSQKNYFDYYTNFIKLSASIINAISLCFKNFRYLNSLTLEISKQNEKIILSDGIQSLQNLKHLNLTLNDFSIEDWIDFNLDGTLIQLKQLNDLVFQVYNSQFGEKEALGFSNGLMNLKYLNRLTIYIRDKNQLNEQGAKSISEAISHLSNLSFLNMIIGESNGIGVTGAESILGLESYLNNLLFLSFYNIKINPKNNLTTQIFDKLQKLKEFKINNINITLNLNTIPSIELLYQQYVNLFLTEENCRLKIILSFEENSFEDFFFFLKPLKDISNLKSLTLGFKDINPDIVISFEKNIQTLQNLEEIKIIIQEKNGNINILIANGLQKLLELKRLEVYLNNLNFISEFIQKIEGLKKLDHLYFQVSYLKNQNKDQQLQIIHSLSQLKNLKSLILNSQIEIQFRSKLFKCLTKKLQSLVVFQMELDRDFYKILQDMVF